MGKTRDHFKKTGDTKELHAKMGTIKDRGGKGLTEAEDIRNTEKNCPKMVLMPNNHNGVVIHLDPDILECEVKWALGSITKNTASGCDGIPGKDECSLSAALNRPANLENSAVAAG